MVKNPVPSDTRKAEEEILLQRRLVAFVLLVGIVTVWIVAYVLQPDGRGLGTHEQLGLAPCRMLTIFGIPCAFCGMTTTFTLMAHGHWVAGFLTQPAGGLLFLLTLPAFAASSYGVVTAKVPRVIETWRYSGRLVLSGCLVLLLGWIYKIVTLSLW